MNLTPLKIKREIAEDGLGSGVSIAWSDNTESHIPSMKLRQSCPCASCQEQRGDTTHAKPLSSGRALLKVVKSTADEETNLLKISAVGNYALGIVWADGHDSGIFTYQHLKNLSEES